MNSDPLRTCWSVRYSLATSFVVEGLKSGDADASQDGWISIDELYDYVCRRIRQDSPGQKPQKGGSGYGDIWIAQNPLAPPASLPRHLRLLIRSNEPDDRFQAVESLARLVLAPNVDRDPSRAAQQALERMIGDSIPRISGRAREVLVEHEERRQADDRSRRDAEERARREAEDQARRGADEQAQREAEERAAQEQAQRETLEEAQRETEEQLEYQAEVGAPPAIVIADPHPQIDDGRYPSKACIGDSIQIEADIFRFGHLLRAVVRYRGPGDERWSEIEMLPIDAHLGGVRWGAQFDVDRVGRWQYTIEAWTDAFGTWRDELARKIATGQHDLTGEISEALVLLRSTAGRTENKADRALIQGAASFLADDRAPESAKHDVVLGPELFAAVEHSQKRHDNVSFPSPLQIEVDRLRARFGSWYELFPRSWGGLKGVESQLARFAQLGFDIVCLPPIHPLGHTNRKGRDNALTAGPTDPGSPWAIGDKTGGHDAVHPELGTIEDMKRLTRTAREHGIEIALGFAIQCSPDHPWLDEHPEWFVRRPDGTLKYAENPPKRYQDVYNVNLQSPQWRELWQALRDIVLHWVECGVTVFLAHQAHTKPFRFWEWLIREVREREPEVLFVAGAPNLKVARSLGKVGFSQALADFPRMISRQELTDYVTTLAYAGHTAQARPNFFANTPDTLHEYLQHGGRPAFEARLVLAATLSPSYGIYSGYEQIENAALRPGSKEYLHSEKYELKARALDGELLPLIQRINYARRENPALQELANTTFLDTANEALIGYAKQSRGNTVVTVVNLDPHNTQEGLTAVPPSLGLPPSFVAHDLLTDERHSWRVGSNYVRLEPGIRQARVIRLES